MLDPDREAELLARAKAGSREALETLLLNAYEPLKARLAAGISARARSVLDVDDVIQNAYSEAFRDFAHFEPRGPGSFVAWLRTIAEHRLLDAMKGLRRQKRGGDRMQIKAREHEDSLRTDVLDLIGDDDALRPSQLARRREAEEALLDAMQALPEDARTALRMRVLDNATLEDIAAAIGRTPDGARGVLQRARAELRERLESPSRWISRDGR